ncbi:MAG: cbb3-type cytochrome oxidase assembly protein CcoS [Rickettsiales bacterium]
MKAFFFLIPVTLILVIVMLLVLFWTLRNRQYDDLKGASERILFDGEKSKKS